MDNQNVALKFHRSRERLTAKPFKAVVLPIPLSRGTDVKLQFVVLDTLPHAVHVIVLKVNCTSLEQQGIVVYHNI